MTCDVPEPERLRIHSERGTTTLGATHEGARRVHEGGGGWTRRGGSVGTEVNQIVVQIAKPEAVRRSDPRRVEQLHATCLEILARAGELARAPSEAEIVEAAPRPFAHDDLILRASVAAGDDSPIRLADVESERGIERPRHLRLRQREPYVLERSDHDCTSRESRGSASPPRRYSHIRS
jgi:hypothetical protein